MQLEIVKELKELIPPLSKDEYSALESNCIQYGIREPISVWGNKIIDGHNRYQIAADHNLGFTTKSYDFNNIEEAKEWMRLNQLGRRNASWILKTYLKGKSKRNQKTNYTQHSLFADDIDVISEVIGFQETNKLLRGDFKGITESDIHKIAQKEESEIYKVFEPLINEKVVNLQASKAHIKKAQEKTLKEWEQRMQVLIHQGHSSFDAYVESKKHIIKVKASKYWSDPTWASGVVELFEANPQTKYQETISQKSQAFQEKSDIKPFTAFSLYVTNSKTGDVINSINILEDLFYFMELLKCNKFMSEVQIQLGINMDTLQEIAKNNSSIKNSINTLTIKNILKTKVHV